MPWTQTHPVEQRKLFVEEARRKRVSFAALCEVFGVSRKTGYKWMSRADDGGASAFADRSRRPHSNPFTTAADAVERLVELRQENPTWGARKLLAWLDRNEPWYLLPAASTATEILRRHGLVKERRRRRRDVTPVRQPLAHATAPNAVWAVDYKGDFLVGDGTRCWPLTVTDAYSRYALCCRGLVTTSLAPTKRVLERTFREYGIPYRMRSDNGTPFGPAGRGPLSQLGVWLLKLGVVPEYTAPASPQENGRHERFHRTLKAETCRPAASSLHAQQRRFDAFLPRYNEQRPHESLGQLPPSLFYRPSLRPFPTRIEAPTYPAHYELRKVNMVGTIKWRGGKLFVSHALSREVVGLVEVDDGLCEMYFGPLLIARFHSALEDLGLVRPG
jgi:transposase InsO family protein